MNSCFLKSYPRLLHTFIGVIFCTLISVSQVSAQLVSDNFLNINSNTRYVCQSNEFNTYNLFIKTSSGLWQVVDAEATIQEHKRLVRLWKNRYIIRTLLRGSNAAQTLKARGRWQTNRQIIKEIKGCGSFVNPDSSVCGIVADGPRNSNLSLRVINGQPCNAGASSVVKLEINYRNSISVCSGTVISPFSVLTAAHCLTGRPVSVTIFTPSGAIETTDFIAHPEFSSDSFQAFETFDVALVYSNIALETRTSTIVVKAPKAGDRGIIAGYGLTENNTSEELNAAEVTINRVFPNGIETIYDGKNNNTNSCFGDSGGPLLVLRNNRWLVAGIVSNGIKSDCGVGDIARYTNVASRAVQDFIAVNIK